MFHHTATFNGVYSQARELFYSEIDLTQDAGLGSVIQKNVVLFQDTLNWGIGACRHSNGQDWWVVMIKDSSDLIFKILFTNSGITSTSQIGFHLTWGNSSQLTFFSKWKSFASTTYYQNYFLWIHLTVQ
ncbi:MAG: hypothetical protein IPK08_16435 [Bacteroidetes bacterium]|nr:hypothetical protein [Bacteroidota bacterium]